MDYNKLKTFEIVAEKGSISAAAKLLRRTQSAISQQILLLEDELELKLLERKNGRIFLSHEGKQIYDIAKQNLGHIDDRILSLKDMHDQTQGHISVATLHDFGTSFDIGQAVGEFCSRYPKITFDIQYMGSAPNIEQALIKNNVDLGFIVMFQDPEMFVRTPVRKSHHSLYTSKQYLKDVGAITSYKDLLDKDLIDLTHDLLGMTQFLEKNAKQVAPHLKELTPAVVAPNLAVTKSIVCSGFGIAMLPDFLVEQEVKSGKIVRLFPSAKQLAGVLDVAYRTNRTPRFCEKVFIEYLVASYSQD